jgi:plastocyanin
MRTTMIGLAAGALLFALVACGGGSDGATGPGPQPPGGPAASAAVSMRSGSDGYGGTQNAFSPASVHIARGGTVTWKNATGVTHNVTFQPAAGAPENIPSQSSGENTRTFDTAATFSYRCTIHPGMTGSVAVE